MFSANVLAIQFQFYCIMLTITVASVTLSVNVLTITVAVATLSVNVLTITVAVACSHVDDNSCSCNAYC